VLRTGWLLHRRVPGSSSRSACYLRPTRHLGLPADVQSACQNRNAYDDASYHPRKIFVPKIRQVRRLLAAEDVYCDVRRPRGEDLRHWGFATKTERSASPPSALVCFNRYETCRV